MDRVTVVILAGGLGTRLKNVIADVPKPMVPINGRPFLEYLFDQVEKSGIKNVVLSIGHKADRIKDHFGDKYHSIQISYSIEQELLGTGGGLRNALERIETPYVIGMNGDSFLGISLEAFAKKNIDSEASLGIAVSYVEDTSRFGNVELSSENQVIKFVEKGAESKEGWINGGIYFLKREVLESIPSNTVVSLEKEIFPHYLSKGIYAYPSKEPFIDIGIPEMYSQAEEFFSLV